MATPRLTPEPIAEVSSLVSGYITAQRENALPFAVALSPEQRATMDGFFCRWCSIPGCSCLLKAVR
jgi:hypothetical protein